MDVLVIKMTPEERVRLTQFLKENNIKEIKETGLYLRELHKTQEKLEEEVNHGVVKDLLLEWMVTTDTELKKEVDVHTEYADGYIADFYFPHKGLKKKIFDFYDVCELRTISEKARDSMYAENTLTGSYFGLKPDEVYRIF